jgi:hypothetical protein
LRRATGYKAKEMDEMRPNKLTVKATVSSKNVVCQHRSATAICVQLKNQLTIEWE